jgi:hypothetical protein
LRRILHQKIGLGLMVRQKWLMYASMAEDLELRKVFWNTNFPSEKKTWVVMHDNTSTPLIKFSHPDTQRACWLDYYADTVAKGGIAIQPLGWIRTLPLCTGGIGDSSYCTWTRWRFLRSKKNLLGTTRRQRNHSWIFWQGYRSTLDAKKNGQFCLQPHFAESDKKFKGDQTLFSACIAVVRSGNEWAVKNVKMSWMLKRGLKGQTWDLVQYSDLWLVWGFNVNFMYNTAH